MIDGDDRCITRTFAAQKALNVLYKSFAEQIQPASCKQLNSRVESTNSWEALSCAFVLRGMTGFVQVCTILFRLFGLSIVFH